MFVVRWFLFYVFFVSFCLCYVYLLLFGSRLKSTATRDAHELLLEGNKKQKQKLCACVYVVCFLFWCVCVLFFCVVCFCSFLSGVCCSLVYGLCVFLIVFVMWFCCCPQTLLALEGFLVVL